MTAVIVGLLLGSMATSPQSPARAASGDTNTIGMTAVLNSTATQPSGSSWEYLVSVSCSAVVGSNCSGVQVTIPMPDSAYTQTGVTGAWSTWSTPTVSADSTLLGGVTSKSVTVSGGNWVIPLSRALNPGEAQVLTLKVTVPTLTTPNGFSWSLRPSVSGSNFATLTASSTAVATATATSTPCAITAGDFSGPVGSTRSTSASWIMAGGTQPQPGTLGATVGTTATGQLSYPAALSFVSNSGLSPAGLVSTPDATNNVVTYSYLVATTGGVGMSSTMNFLLVGPVGTYTVTLTASYTPLGASAPVTCSRTAAVTITDSAITGTIWSKSATGRSTAGTASSSSGTAYAAASQEGLIGGSSSWNLGIARKSATLQSLHLFDGMPCRTSGSGRTAADPYVSLAEADEPCADPAFVVRLVTGLVPMTGQKVTFEYADGSSALISPTVTGTASSSRSSSATCSSTTPCFIPDPSKTVASIIVDGSYSVDDTQASKTFTLLGAPSADLSTDQQWYLRNTGTTSGANFDSSSLSAGMVTPLGSSVTSGISQSNSYTYTATWTGYQGGTPCVDLYAMACTGSYTSDSRLASQRRTAVVVPAGSDLNVTSVTSSSSSNTSNGTVATPQTGDYGGFGPGSTRYLLDASEMKGAPVPTGQGIAAYVKFGGMQPGVYQYYTYTGFTSADPSDGGATCTIGTGKTVVTDTTGIIGDPGVPRVLCRAVNTVIVNAPAVGINVTKQVRNVTEGSGWLNSPSAVVAAPGDAVEFRVRVSNTGPAALTNVALYDILPHAADTGISASQVSQPRGSTRDVSLASLPDTPAGWSLNYSTSTNPCRPEVGVAVGTGGCVDDWSASGTAATVRALRVTIPSLPVATGAVPYHEFILSYEVPSASTWSSGDIEWNSVAAGGTYQALTLSPVEAAKVGFKFWPGLFVSKVGADSPGAGLAGSGWEVLSDDGGSPGAAYAAAAVSDVPDHTGLFQISGLRAPGTYWLQEAKAPDGYTLLAQPVQFTVGATGNVALGAGAAANITLGTAPVPGYPDDQWIATIRDPHPLLLPMTGGRGALLFWTSGAAVAAGAIFLAHRRRRNDDGNIAVVE